MAISFGTNREMQLINNCDSLTGISGGHDGLEGYGYNLQKSTSFDSLTIAIRKNETIPVTFSTTVTGLTTDSQVIAWAASSVPHLADVQSMTINGSGGSTSAQDVKAEMVGWFTPFAFAYDSGSLGTQFNSCVWTWDASGQNVRTANNIWMDYLYVGDGLDIAGTTASDSLFTEAQSYDETNNTYNGVLTANSGIIFSQHNVYISTTQGHSFGETIVFYETTFGQNAYVLEGNGELDARGTQILKSGTVTLDLDFTGMTVNIEGGVINYDTLVMVAGQVLSGTTLADGGTATLANAPVDCSFNNCGQITLTGTLSNAALSLPNLTANTAAVVCDDLADVGNASFTRGTLGHAVELTSIGGGSMNWDGVLSGYKTQAAIGSPITATALGTEAIWVNVGSGTLTINVGADATLPSIRTTGAVVNLVSAGGSLKFTVSPVPSPNYEWRLYTVTTVGSLAGAVELIGTENETVASPAVYPHQYTNQPVAVQIISNEYEESITYFTLDSSTQTPTIFLGLDDND